MTIHIVVGNVGSGKTLGVVRDMFLDGERIKTYSNIKTKLKNQIDINPDMIIKKEIEGTKKKRNGEEENIYKYSLNLEYWTNIKENINVVIDEAHSIINSRRSMSKINILLTDWMALVRRILTSKDNIGKAGTLILITQFPSRIDTIARMMATQVKYNVGHFIKSCKKCGLSWRENSDHPEPLWQCMSCGSYKIFKHSHSIEVWKFKNIELYEIWKNGFEGSKGNRPFYAHYFITDTEKYFDKYDTLQIDNMFGSFY